MRNSFKRIAAMLLALVMVLGMAACSSKTEAPASNAPASESTASSESSIPAEAPAEERELLTYTVLNQNISINGSDTKVGQYIKDKFGIEFVFEKYTGDMEEQASLWLAAGTYPEIVQFIGGNQDLVKKYIAADALLPLDPYLDSCENIQKMYAESEEIIRSYAADGRMYFWDPGGPDKRESTGVPFEMSVRSDLLEKLGYPTLETTDDWLQFIRDAVALEPETNGLKTIGFTMPLGETYAVPLIPSLPRTARYQYLGRNKMLMADCTDGQLYYFYELDETKEAMKFFNTLYREGLFDKEAFSDMDQQTKDKMALGTPVCIWYVNWFNGQANAQLAANGHEDMQYSVLPIQVTSSHEKGEDRYYRYTAFRGFDMCGMTKKMDHPERFAELLDWAMSPEGQVMLGWGIEGEHYTIDENGMRKPTEATLEGYRSVEQYLSKEGIGLFSFLGLSADVDANGQSYSMTQDATFIVDSFTDTQRKVLDAYGWSDYLEPFGGFTGIEQTDYMTAFGMLDATSELAKKEQTLAQASNDAVAAIVTAESDEAFEAAWNKAVEDIQNAGAAEIKAFYTEEYLKAAAN